MSESRQFDQVDAFLPGTLGPPGERIFYLQVQADGEHVTLKCEKQQVKLLGEHLRTMLSDLPEEPDPRSPSEVAVVPPDSAEFILGAIGLGYDESADAIVLSLEEADLVDADGDPVPGTDGRVVVRLTRAQAGWFADQARVLVSAGRPVCPLCLDPVDPDGHACPRMN